LQSTTPAAAVAPGTSYNAVVQITDRMLMHPDARTVLRSVLKAWLPLSEAVLSMAVEHLPDPASAAPGRLARLLPPQQLHLKGVQLPKDLQQVWVGLAFRFHDLCLSLSNVEVPCLVEAARRVA